MGKAVSIVVCGAKGKMGQRIIALATANPDLKVAGAIDIGDDLNAVVETADAVISFAVPEGSLEHARICSTAGTPIVIGTTGFAEKDISEIERLSQTIPLLVASNMSAGVNVMWKIAAEAAKALAQAQVKIVEVHHTQKKDAPSGTAITLAQEAARARGLDWKKIPIESIRRGEVVGDHTLTFELPGETLIIQHRAGTRDIFAYGALKAAQWIVGKKPGLYEMADVLEMKR